MQCQSARIRSARMNRLSARIEATVALRFADREGEVLVPVSAPCGQTGAVPLRQRLIASAKLICLASGRWEDATTNQRNAA